MTVGELVALLQHFDENTKVVRVVGIGMEDIYELDTRCVVNNFAPNASDEIVVVIE